MPINSTKGLQDQTAIFSILNWILKRKLVKSSSACKASIPRNHYKYEALFIIIVITDSPLFNKMFDPKGTDFVRKLSLYLNFRLTTKFYNLKHKFIKCVYYKIGNPVAINEWLASNTWLYRNT